jgi:hypothetical protein
MVSGSAQCMLGKSRAFMGNVNPEIEAQIKYARKQQASVL